MTKKQKLDTFDHVAAKADKLALALYDLVNHKFGTAERVMFKDFDTRERSGSILVRMSWRAMPLFLVKNDNDSVDVYTESEIEDMYRKSPTVPYYQMLKVAMDRLERKELAKSKPQFYECGICGQYHSIKWNGDCRQDNARFNPEDLDAKFGNYIHEYS